MLTKSYTAKSENHDSSQELVGKEEIGFALGNRLSKVAN